LGFGPVVVGQSSSVTSFTITNNGQQQSGVLTVTSSNLAEFAVQTGASGDCVSGTTMLAGNASCTVRTIFTPSTAGARSGMFTFSATPGGNGSVSVSGAGITPGSLTASASVVPFGNVPLGSSSSVGSFTITNNGQQASGLLAVASSSGLFVIQTGANGDCGSSLAGNDSCTVRIVFTPTAVGGSSETITFSGTPGGSGSVSVTGSGVLPSCTLGISKLGSCKLGPQ
jgi:copper(I)-binding protein